MGKVHSVNCWFILAVRDLCWALLASHLNVLMIASNAWQNKWFLVVCSSSCTTSSRLTTIMIPAAASPTFPASLSPSPWILLPSMTSAIQHDTYSSHRPSLKKMCTQLLQLCCMQRKSWKLTRMLAAFRRPTKREAGDLCASTLSNATTQVGTTAFLKS